MGSIGGGGGVGGARFGPGPANAVLGGVCVEELDGWGGRILECGWTAGEDGVGGGGSCLWLIGGV